MGGLILLRCLGGIRGKVGHVTIRWKGLGTEMKNIALKMEYTDFGSVTLRESFRFQFFETGIIHS